MSFNGGSMDAALRHFSLLQTATRPVQNCLYSCNQRGSLGHAGVCLLLLAQGLLVGNCGGSVFPIPNAALASGTGADGLARLVDFDAHTAAVHSTQTDLDQPHQR
jgi:hypothetical protein